MKKNNSNQPEVKPNTAFIIIPFMTSWSSKITQAIKEAFNDCGIVAKRLDDLAAVNEDLLQNTKSAIKRAEYVIVDVSETNGNVFFEYGIAEALEKNIILICQNPNNIPSDIAGKFYLKYDIDATGVEKLKKDISKAVNKIKLAEMNKTSE